MPARNIVPKPVQKPHPPLWVACSNRETIKLAARLGIGALTFAFVDPAEAKQWVDDYYRIIQRGVRADRPRGERQHRHGLQLRRCTTRPPRRGDASRTASASSSSRSAGTMASATNCPAAPISGRKFQAALPHMPHGCRGRGRHRHAGADCASTCASSRTAGVDQVAFIQQGGRNRHEHICEALELFAERGDGRVQGARRPSASGARTRNSPPTSRPRWRGSTT